MAVARNGGLITVSGVENDGRNLDTHVGRLGVGGTEILAALNPRRATIFIKTARIILTGHLKIDPEQETLLFADDQLLGTGTVPTTNHAQNGSGGAIEVRSGGHLEIGTATAGTDGTSYSKGDGIVQTRRGPNQHDVGYAVILGLPGSRVTLRGCTIHSLAPARFDGPRTSAPVAASCILRINDVIWDAGPDEAIEYFAPRLFTDNYQIDGLHMLGGVLQIQNRSATSYIRNITIDRMQGGVGVTGNSFGADTDFYELEGVDGNHDSPIDVNVFNGMKARIISSRTGTLIKADLQGRDHINRSYGVIECRQKLRLVLKDAAGNAVQGARVHLADTVAGRGHENWTQKNVGNAQLGSPSTAVNYTNQRTYSALSDAQGVVSFETDGGILVGEKVYDARPAAGQTHAAKPFRLRGKTAVLGDDLFDVYVHSYGYLTAALTLPLKGLQRTQADVTLVADPNVTAATAAAANIAGLAVDHDTDIVTVSAAVNLDQLYDYLKRDKTLPGSETHPTRAGMVAMADGTILDIGGYSLSVGDGGIISPGVKFKSLKSTAVIQSVGTGRIDAGYQDTNGKVLIVNLGAAQTPFVWDADGGPTTYVAGTALTTARITVPADATVNLTVKRVGHDYRKYSVAAAEVAAIDVDLPRNLNVDTASQIGHLNLALWREAANTVYDSNVYFDKHAALPHVLRLGNVDLTGNQAVSRAIFDRRMTSQAALEATHVHDDAANGRAYDIRNDRIRLDTGWCTLGRQPLTIPPNPAQGDGSAPGTLAKIATFGLYITTDDEITAYVPSRRDTYVVVVDPLTDPFSPTPADLLTAAESVTMSMQFLSSLARSVAVHMRPDIQGVGDDIQGVSDQIDALPIDELLTVRTVRHTLGMAGAHVWNSQAGAFSVESGAWQFDFDANADPGQAGTGALTMENPPDFTINVPAGDSLTIRVRMRAQALEGPARDIDPGLSMEWTPAAGASVDVQRTLIDVDPTRPVSLRATTGGLGPAIDVDCDLGHVADSITIDTGSITLHATGADQRLRVVIESIQFLTRHPATLADFRADVSNLDVAVSTRLAAGDYVAGTTAREALVPELAHGAPNAPARVGDAAFNVGGSYVSGDFGRTIRAVWRLPSLRPDQSPRIRASIQLKRHDGTDPRGGFPFGQAATADLYIGQGLDGTRDAGTRILRHHYPNGAIAAVPPVSVAFAAGDRAETFDSVMLVLRAPPSNVPVRAYLWNLAIEVDGLRYVMDLARNRLDDTISSRATAADIPAAPDLSNLDVAVSTRLASDDYTDPPSPATIAAEIWEKAIVDYASQPDHDGEIGYELYQMRQRIIDLHGRVPADLTARLTTLRDRLPADVADNVALALKVVAADMQITADQVILTYDGAEVMRFNRRANPDAGDFSGGRTRVI